MSSGETSYDVRVWSVEARAGKRGTTYRVRRVVAGSRFEERFDTRKLADAFRSGLLQASSKGEAFDPVTGRRLSELRSSTADRRWVEVAREFIDDRWHDFSPRHRKSTVEGLVTITCALTDATYAAPDAATLRAALTHWEFNPGARGRSERPPTDYAEALDWIAKRSLTLEQVATADGIRAALRAIGTKLDGTNASAATTVRKRAALSAVLNFAVESRYLNHNPLSDVRRKREPLIDAVDPRVVVNPNQARALLAAVRRIAPDLHAFFATLYYAGARPAEARNLRRLDAALPPSGWGRLVLAGSYQEAGVSWTDDGARGEERQLKHRSPKAVRPVPAHPDLVAALRTHLSTFGTGADDRLFVARAGRGGRPLQGPLTEPVGMSRIYRVWQLARQKALSPEQVASPLAARPYDLRHACLSTWLSAGVPPTQVAQWAGHGVDVLLRVYAKCLDDTEPLALARIESVLAPAVRETPKAKPASPVTAASPSAAPPGQPAGRSQRQNPPALGL